MTYDEMITVIQAAKGGEVIQVKHKTWDAWKPCESKPNFSFDVFDYRVKPEPREWDMYVNPEGLLTSASTYYSGVNPKDNKKIRVREVLED